MGNQTKKLVATMLLAVLMTQTAMAGTATRLVIHKSVADLIRSNAQRDLSRQAAYALAAEASDSDGDGYIEAPAVDAGSGPTGGGLVPATSAAPKNDSFGKTLGYCSWDNGAVTGSVGRINGISSMARPTLAVVSAGLDNTYQTTCADIVANGVAGGDDHVAMFTAMQLSQGVGGTLYYGAPVADLAALNALDTSALTDGEVRLVKSSNSLYRWDATAPGTWTAIGSGASDFTRLGTGNYAGAQANGALAAITTGQDNIAIGDNASLTVTTGSGNIAIGKSSLSSITNGQGHVAIGHEAAMNMTSNDVMEYNTALGTYALRGSGTPASNTGIGNTAIGQSTLYSISSGNYNTGVGAYAGYSVQSGLNNSMTGYYAGYSLTNGSGNVMVGSTSGASITTGNYAVAVGSGALMAEATGWGSTAIGTGSQEFSNINSGALTDNTSVGYNSLRGRSIVSGGMTGTSLTAIGSKALYSVSTGGASTAIGVEALYSTTTGTSNVAIGNRALYLNSTGGSNVALGLQAAYNQQTGSLITAIGHQAQYNMRATSATANNVSLGAYAMYGSGTPASNNGTYNTAIGSSTLYTLTSGTYNTAVGYTALRSVSSGSSNAALGAAAIYSNTTGGSNTAAGREALYTNTTGSSNVAIGYRAAYTQGTGSLNTALGYQAMYQMKTTSATSNNVAIGPNAMYGSGVTASNTGVDNIATGASALYGISSGSGNIAVGSEALYELQAGTGSIAIGYRAQKYMAPLINSNIAIGYEAMLSASGQGTGFDNIGIGYTSLRGVTTGSNNIAIGKEALYNAATYSNNVGIGNASLSAVVGDGYTAVGYYAHTYLTSSGLNHGPNVAVGMHALLGNSGTVASNTAEGNVGIGYSASKDITTGNKNTAVGNYAMTRFSTGGSNVAVGHSALAGSGTAANNTGSDNVAIGVSALAALSSGINNTVAGSQAGGAVTTGTHNVLVGYGAGPSVATGTYNTLLGSQADATDGITYATAIGAGASVTTSGTIALGRAASDVVVIGQTGAQAGYKFYVLTDATNTSIGGNAAWTNTSDARLKTNVRPITGAMDIIGKLQGVRYQWDQTRVPGWDHGVQIGFLAQQIEPYLPEVVRTDRNGWKGVQYAPVVALLVEGIKEQQGRLGEHQKTLDEHRIALNELLDRMTKAELEAVSLKSSIDKADETLKLHARVIDMFEERQAGWTWKGTFLADRIEAQEAKFRALEVEQARIKEIEAEKVKAGRVQSGEVSMFVMLGTFGDLFAPPPGAHYMVTVTADDGSYATASAFNVNGHVEVVPIKSSGLDLAVNGPSVSVVAPSKTIKASWVRTS